MALTRSSGVTGVAPGEYRLDVRSKAALERLGAGEGGVATSQAEAAPEYASVPLDVVEDGQLEAAAQQKLRVQTYDVDARTLSLTVK